MLMKKVLLLFSATIITSLIHGQFIINPGVSTNPNGSFENATQTFPANGWTVVNGTDNHWRVGNITNCVGTNSAYIGQSAGVNTYTNVSSINHLYRDVTFPSSPTCFTLSFNWKAQSESSYDRIRVYLVPTSSTISAGSLPTGGIELTTTYLSGNTTCQTFSTTIPASNAGTTKRLVFTWQNDGSINGSTAATVDNISLTYQAPSAPSCATALNPANLATNFSPCTPITWDQPTSSGCNAVTSYDIYLGTSPAPPFLANTTSTSYQAQLNFNQTYYYQIVPKNAIGDAVGCPVLQFTTVNPSSQNYNLTDNATSSAPYNCATLTPNSSSQKGCAWDINSTLNFASNFTYDIKVNLGSNDGGGDGMAFVFQNDPLGRCKCGASGDGLGASGISNSVIVEIDTYLNTNDRDDFNPMIGCFGTEDPDHIDIWFNGNVNPDTDGDCSAIGAGERPATPYAIRLQNSGSNYNIENGLDHTFRITWNAATQTLTAEVLDNGATTSYGVISATFNPLTIFGTNTPYFGFTASTGGATNQQSYCLPSVLLPVEVKAVDVACQGEDVLVSWKTESERENNYFTIEQSCDGIHFSPAKKILGAGNSTTEKAYREVLPTMCDGVNYFQLVQFDNNGKRTEIATRSIKPCSDFSDISIYPNPTKDKVTVLWSDKDVRLIQLTNSLGQVIQTIDTNESTTKAIELTTTDLRSGVYFITIQKETNARTFKLIIED